MHRYFIHTPWWLPRLYGSYTWHKERRGNKVYLTFDDGPHPSVTPWVLDLLGRAGAKATFFCIGRNVAQYPHVFERILNEGHAVGNHTHSHLNGWKVSKEVYWEDTAKAAALIDTHLFRPPYGRITRAQGLGLSRVLQREVKVTMWDVLSADFDSSYTPAQCTANVVKGLQPGAIIVFHDSEKARVNLEGSLPAVLRVIGERGLQCCGL